MGKFRSKLKRNAKGKTWSRGHASTSNPTNMKHRIKAKSRFFQPNLSLAPEEEKPKNSLTIDALIKHNARQQFANNNYEPTVNDIASSLKSVNLNQEDELMSESQISGTQNTFKTFASNYSSCSNMSFKKLLNGFRTNSDLHKEMLAILTALTEIIKERGGTQSSTEYFLLLIETIEASKEEKELIAALSLLSMGIKSVPQAVLRKKFSETAQMLMENLEKFIEHESKTIIKYIIGCMSVLLRAQDYSTWTYSSNFQYIDAILVFTIHSKPRIRKAAQHAIVSIMCASSFMLEQKNNENQSDNDEEEKLENKPKIKYHPASGRVAKFCINQFKPEILATSQTIVLHVLGLLNDVIKTFKSVDIRTICEQLLSIMTASNVLLRTKCLQVFHSLFASKTENLNGTLCGKLIAAIFEYRPDKTDVRQTLAWLTVLKEGYLHLNLLDTNLCLNSLPKLTDICTTELWITDRSELINNVSVTIKELLMDCVKPVCETIETAEQYRNPIEKIIKQILRALNTPFGEFSKYIILTCSILFESVGSHFSDAVHEIITSLGNRYDSNAQISIHIENAIQSAITHIGVENVLKAIPLTNKENDVILDRSWLLPVLRTGINGSTFEFFRNHILKVAVICDRKWNEFKDKDDQKVLSHTYELLCCQLWSLLPGFCRNPKDPENFKMIAKTIGIALKNNIQFREPILDGLFELIMNANDECRSELKGFAKNFLPILFNIYAEKPNGTYEIEIREQILDVIKNYLTITPEPLLQELFQTALTQVKTLPIGTFESDSVVDILYALTIYQPEDKLKEFLKNTITPVLKCNNAKDKERLKKQQKKSYELLYNLLTEERESCVKFRKKCKNTIQKVLFEALNSIFPSCRAARLRCLKILIENQQNITTKDDIVTKTIPEAIVSFKEFSTKKENISQELVTLIGDLYQKEDKLNDFIDIVMAGFGGDQVLIENTILALRSIVQHLPGHLTVSTLEFILQQIMVFLVQKNRQHSEASVLFLITFIKVLPSPLIANHLEFIMKSLSAMVPDTKRFCRIPLGFLLKKLCKKFSADELIKFVPGNDELTHKRLKKIRKLLRRENRKKQEEENRTSDDESDDEFVSGLEKKSLTIDDILADSDSDLPEDYDEEEKTDLNDKKRKLSKKKKNEVYIQEDPEEIIDLADVNSVGNILTEKSAKSAKGKVETKKSKDPNRGFKLAEDGRLIISDKDVGGDDSDDSDDDDDESDNKQNKKSRKRAFDEDSSSDDDEEMTDARKRKRLTDKTSVVSGKSGVSRYTAGGKGIHRPIKGGGSGASVKSGKSTKSSKSTAAKSVKSGFGSEYKSTKAKGDMKKKGKLDPYAYIPLSRNVLNKRKRAKNAGQFKNIVAGARKGALKGVKNKIQKKKYKK